MSARATEIVFLPGFDGAAQLRGEFVAALAARFPARAVSYPNRTLGSLDAYWQHAAATLEAGARPIVIGESLSGLVAARWAANDSRVAGLVLCGAFARNPAPFVAPLGASMPSLAKFLALKFMSPAMAMQADVRSGNWSRGLRAAFGALHRDVIGERLRLIAQAHAGPDLSALRIPVVLVQFEADLVIRAADRRHLESVCHNAEIVRLPGPHFALETRPVECAQEIARRVAPILEEDRQTV